MKDEMAQTSKDHLNFHSAVVSPKYGVSSSIKVLSSKPVTSATSKFEGKINVKKSFSPDEFIDKNLNQNSVVNLFYNHDNFIGAAELQPNYQQLNFKTEQTRKSDTNTPLKAGRQVISSKKGEKKLVSRPNDLDYVHPTGQSAEKPENKEKKAL